MLRSLQDMQRTKESPNPGTAARPNLVVAQARSLFDSVFASRTDEVRKKMFATYFCNKNDRVAIYAFGDDASKVPECVGFAIGHDGTQNDGLYVPSMHPSFHARSIHPSIRPSIHPSIHPIQAHLSAAQVHG